MVSKTIGIEANITPKRTLVPIDATVDNNTLTLKSPVENVYTSFAALDAFNVTTGKAISRNNLLYMKSREVVVNVGYPYETTGILLSFGSFIFLILLGMYVYRKNREDDNV